MANMLDAISNFHWVQRDEAARSAQPMRLVLPGILRRHKIGSVINLRGRNTQFSWWAYETRICSAHSVTHFDTMLDSRKLPLRSMLTTLLDAFDDAPKPFLLKCSGGQDRSSLASAIYLVHRKGWAAYDEAQDQFSRWPYLHFPKRHQRWLKHFLRYARDESKGQPIGIWIRMSYAPDHLARWLDEQGLQDTYKEIFTKPEASRWQW